MALFDDALPFSSAQPRSHRKEALLLGATTLEATLAALLVAAPLLHPATLPALHLAPHAIAFVPPAPVPRPVRVQPEAARSSAPAAPAALAVPAAPAVRSAPAAGTSQADAPPPLTVGSTGMSMGTAAGGGDLLGLPGGASSGSMPAVVAAPPRAHAPARISSGVLAGLLLAPIRPDYPALARTTRVSGTVVLSAVIDRTGRIQALTVVSGPELLRASALAAVSAARYHPYLLNGEPTEVQTTISVNYRLGES